MNPFLESPSHWEDFHTEFITHLRAALVPQLGDRYRAKLSELLFIHTLEDAPRPVKPDTSIVIEPGVAKSSRSPGGGAAVLEAPVRLELPAPETAEHHPYIEITDRAGREVVCAIELLSRANKRFGRDQGMYLAKRRALLDAGSHFIEIDLLRTTPRLIDELPRGKPPPLDYYVMLSRAPQQPSVGLWPIRLRDRLPVIPIPLRPPDADARIDLQEILHAAYDAAGYAAYIYEERPEPPLEPEDARWAEEIIRRDGTHGSAR